MNSRKNLRVSDSAVRVKICGLTCVEDAVACAEVGCRLDRPEFPSAFAAICRAPEVAADIIAALPGLRRRSRRICGPAGRRSGRGRPNGSGSGSFSCTARNRRKTCSHSSISGSIRAFRLEPSVGLGWRVRDYLARADALGRPPDAVLVDAYVAGQPGGTGRLIADDDPGSQAPPTPPDPGRRPDPRNVAERVARVRPWMVDVASGVESSPGRKDPAAVAAFIRATRAAARLIDELPPR